MAIMRSGPGTRAKKTSTSRKVTSKDVVSKIRDVFSGGSKNLGKAKGPGGLAGVVSNKGGVRTTTAVKVTGSKKAGIESLKAKRKSGEMTRKEANTKIKNLRDVGVKAKSPGYGYYPVSEEFGVNKKQPAGLFKSQVKKTKLPSDSAGYFNTLKSINPTEGKATQADMSRHQLMVKKMFPNATFTYGKRGGNTNLSVKFNTPLNQMNAKQKAYYTKMYKGNK
jgi:hypothetical protein